jgi:hypothetical protein
VDNQVVLAVVVVLGVAVEMELVVKDILAELLETLTLVVVVVVQEMRELTMV